MIGFWFAFFAGFTITTVAIRLTSLIAMKIGLLDMPGGRKQHKEPVPLVGGISIYLSLLFGWWILPVMEIDNIETAMLLCSGLLVAVGVLDDRYSLSARMRIIFQIVVALIMISNNIVLHDFGTILSANRLSLGVIAIPLTIFATIGVINAINMIDGIDGLAGIVSLTIIAPLLVVLYFSNGFQTELILLACLTGSIGGFLLYNLRLQSGEKARVFLGDSGSTLLGFIFVWLFISITQDDHRAMSPVTALWIFAIPLIDTVGVLLRRLKWGISPFSADRYHIHHILMNAGLTVNQTVFLIASIQLLLGIVGITGHYLGVSQTIMFAGFLGISGCYIYAISQPKRSIPMISRLYQKMGFIREDVTKVFVGGISAESAKIHIEEILGDKLNEYQFEIYEGKTSLSEHFTFVLVEAYSKANVKEIINRLHRYQDRIKVKQIRPFLPRKPANDPINRDLYNIFNVGKSDRRSSQIKRIYCSKTSAKQMTNSFHIAEQDN